MARKRAAPPPKAYFEALQKIFELESAVLTAALPHMGERGRNDEERCRAYLRRVLPKRFSIGTGFVVCSDPSVETKHRQTDVIVYDEVMNAPLHSELAASVFPVEMVYGALEVKGRLQPKDLGDIASNIAEFRRLGKNRWIRHFGETAGDRPFVTTADVNVPRAGRNFVFAYDATWKTAKAFQAAVQRAFERNPAAHLHGMVVLRPNWYIYQVAHSQGGVRTKFFSDNALLRFTRNMLISLGSMPMAPAAMDRYFKLDEYAIEGVELPKP